MSVIERVLNSRRAHLERLTPVEALRAQRDGALLVDTRPVVNRAAEGEIPGALVIDRNVLEWRLDPTSPHRVPEADSPDLHVVLFCNEGYASSLAAVQLQELGLARATDLVGGFRAWREAGLPVTEPARERDSVSAS
ncbi:MULTISPECIES: rhodanese-like domain-containing protein [unclassified Nocardiopsis]|uniref:rhodanese-like domain-containing protein n=1 Tax=unclassified Nocardiopsis TaxID=2649073 RepID=UPI00066E537D|nr:MULTISPECIES: rhodanese-like domain-containing protein [unclassified Nocardiopsis]MBQ1082870.1 rhodanese-like domain-containing protein [Nocardiopsis sp. B62]